MTLVITENRSLEPFLTQQDSTNTKVQFVLRCTKGCGSSTENMINHLKPKHRTHVIHESEDHTTTPAQEEIRSQIVKRKISLLEGTKQRRGQIT